MPSPPSVRAAIALTSPHSSDLHFGEAGTPPSARATAPLIQIIFHLSE
jgi:hypothetical protein